LLSNGGQTQRNITKAPSSSIIISIGTPKRCARKLRHDGEFMTQYLVAIHHPDNFDPSTESEAMMRDVDLLNEEMEAAGARVFARGLTT
jgi:hypothetical protein